MQTIINLEKKQNQLIPEDVRKPIQISWFFSIIFLLITIIYFFISQPELPLFYSVATKQDQLAPKIFIFLFPFISIIINTLHFFIAKNLEKFSLILLKLFIGTTITLQVLVGFSLVRIILITI